MTNPIDPPNKIQGLPLLGGLAYLTILLVYAPDRTAAPEPATAAPASADTPPPGIIVTESASAAPPRDPSAARDFPGDALLQGYGEPSQPPARDLKLLSHAIENFLLVSKSLRDRPLATNTDWSNALRGQLPGADRWLSDGNRVFGTTGQLSDRWGSPLFFHALGGRRWEIRSAGPDRELWTGDDTILKPTGSGGTP